MRNNCGFILIAVLIFLQVFALLGWYALNNELLEMKMTGLTWQDHLVLNQTHNALNEVIHESDFGNCLIISKSDEQFAQLPLNFWQSFSSCSGNFSLFQYYYVVEFLGEDPCAVVSLTNQTANYYRLTLIGLYQHQRKILQATIINSSGHTAAVCKGIKHIVNAGRQSVRQII